MTLESFAARPLAASDHGGVKAALGATLGMATGFGSLALTSVFIGPLGTEFGWSKSELSLCYTLAAVGMAIGGVVWGRISDRTDIRYLLYIGGAFIVLPLLIMSQATDLWQFYAANLMLGVAGFGCLYAPLVSAAGEWFESRRGLVMGIVTAGGALGQGVMPYAAESFISAVGWREAFFLVAVGVLVLQLLVGVLVRRRGPAAVAACHNAVGRGRSGTLQRPRLMLLALAAFLCCACMGTPLVHLAGFVTSVCGSSAFGATSLLVAMIFGAIGRVCFGMIADRYGNLFSYGSASLLQTLCIPVFPLLQFELPILALSAVFGFGFAGNMTCLILCVRDEAPAEAFGGAIGLVMFIAWAGMGVGGYLGGALFDLSGAYGLPFLVAALFGVANLLVLAVLGLLRRTARQTGRST
ncbi:MFS transporter [Roseibium salinum]|uniref:MFS transporter n=1 Tax=Roseibium salinum TaxID=1604349 RepID=A0ABT3R9K0_9HYPH|nr:MFS transporter [Roseibium sp. DSM 29163]MCX2725705.1 MFS transporter [Roseibium sp. DSM 29163]